MKKLFQFLGEINPITFVLLYFVFTFLATFLVYYVPIFKLNSSLENTDITSFFNSLYFSFITITTVGYGDIVPGNGATRFLVVILAFSGVVLTGLFLNSLAYKISLITQKKDEERFEEEKRKIEIEKYSNLIEIIYEDIRNFVLVTYVLVNRDIEKSQKPENLINIEFKISDFRYIYKPSFLRKYGFNRSRIEIFYQVFDKLNNDIEEFLKLGYFSFDQDLMKKTIRYLTACNAIDVRDHILISDTEHQNFIIKMLTDIKETFEIGEIANIADSFVLLRDQIKLTMAIIDEIYKRKSLES